MKGILFLPILILAALPLAQAAVPTPPLTAFLTLPLQDAGFILKVTYAGNILEVGYTPGAINIYYIAGRGEIVVKITNRLFWYRTGTENALLWHPQELLLSGFFVPTRSSVLYLYLISPSLAYAD